MKKLILSILTVIAFMPAAAQENTSFVVINKSNVNVRTEPSTSGAKAGTAAKFSVYESLGGTDGWNKINYNGNPAYVSSSLSTELETFFPDDLLTGYHESTEGWDDLRFSGGISFSKIDTDHILIDMEWMRMNLPAELYRYVGEKRNGTYYAVYMLNPYDDTDGKTLAELLTDAEKLEESLPVVYNEWEDAIYFNNAKFSRSE